MEKYIVFVSGLSGTGKSTIKEYFDQNPITEYRVYDFDKGKNKCPEDEKYHLKWRSDQTEHWLKIGTENLKKNLGTIIFGLSLYPQNIIKMAERHGIKESQLKFGYLITEDEERKKRLFDRGTPRHWQGEKPWYKIFYQELKDVNAKEFNTSGKKIEVLVGEIIKWMAE